MSCIIMPSPLPEYRSSLCIITSTDDLPRAKDIIERSYVAVAVIDPTIPLSSVTIDLTKTSINVMTGDEYMAACNWHFDHTM